MDHVGVATSKVVGASQVRDAQAPGCATRTQFQAGPLSPQGSWSQSEMSWQIWPAEDPRKMGLATGSPLTAWWETWPLRPRLQWPLAFCALASLPHGRAVNGSWLTLLWYLLGYDTLVSTTDATVRQQSLPTGNILFFPFVSLPFPQFEFSLFSLCYITQPPESLLMVFNTGPFPKDRWGSPHLHTQPPLAVGWHERVSHFSAGNCHSALFLWWFFFFGYVALWDSNLPHLTPSVGGFPTVWKLLLLFNSLPRRSPSWNPLSPFLSLSFVLPHFNVDSHFKEIDLPFWVSGVFHQCSEVVLWKLLHTQKIFWCICGEKVVTLSYSSTILGPV